MCCGTVPSMELTTYTMSTSDLQHHGNECIALFVDALANDGVLPEDLCEKLKSNYAVVVYRKGYFGRFLEKLWNTGDKDTSMKIAKFGTVDKFEPNPTRPKLQLVQNETTAD